MYDCTTYDDVVHVYVHIHIHHLQAQEGAKVRRGRPHLVPALSHMVHRASCIAGLPALHCAVLRWHPCIAHGARRPTRLRRRPVPLYRYMGSVSVLLGARSSMSAAVPVFEARRAPHFRRPPAPSLLPRTKAARATSRFFLLLGPWPGACACSSPTALAPGPIDSALFLSPPVELETHARQNGRWMPKKRTSPPAWSVAMWVACCGQWTNGEMADAASDDEDEDEAHRADDDRPGIRRAATRPPEGEPAGPTAKSRGTMRSDAQRCAAPGQPVLVGRPRGQATPPGTSYRDDQDLGCRAGHRARQQSLLAWTQQAEQGLAWPLLRPGAAVFRVRVYVHTSILCLVCARLVLPRPEKARFTRHPARRRPPRKNPGRGATHPLPARIRRTSSLYGACPEQDAAVLSPLPPSFPPSRNSLVSVHGANFHLSSQPYSP